MAHKKRSHEISKTKNESQFVSNLSQAELNYYQRLLPSSLLMGYELSQSKPKPQPHSNYVCITSNCDDKADDERFKCKECNNYWCSKECMMNNKHKHYSTKHHIWKYKKLDTRIPDVFANFNDHNGNNLLSQKQFNTKYKYENTIIETENNYKISKIRMNNNNTFKAMKTRIISLGEKYKDERKNADDILSKWIVMRDLGILKECEIYNNKYSIHCVQKLWHTDLDTYIQNNANNNMFSPDKINENIALLMKSIIPKIKLIHSNGIVIGDIKPSNLVMNYDKNRNIPIDFGIIDFGCICENDSLWYKSFGTFAYRAPEMDIDSSCGEYFIISDSFDIYSLGISLLEIINGKHPYINQLIESFKYAKISNELNDFIDHERIDKIIEDNKWLQLSQNYDFKELFDSMISVDKMFRPTATEIMNHPWYIKYCSS